MQIETVSDQSRQSGSVAAVGDVAAIGAQAGGQEEAAKPDAVAETRGHHAQLPQLSMVSPD